jgi:hypothetical protein
MHGMTIFSLSIRGQAAPTETERLWRQAVAPPSSPRHPTRIWLGRRGLWWPRQELPAAIAWLDVAFLPGAHAIDGAAGALVATCAPVAAWCAAWPDLPPPRGLLLLPLSPSGLPLGGGIRRTLGATRGGAIVLGDPRCPHGAAIVQDLADGLTLAARFPETALVAAAEADWCCPDLARDLAQSDPERAGPLPVRLFVYPPQAARRRAVGTAFGVRGPSGAPALQILPQDRPLAATAARRPLAQGRAAQIMAYADYLMATKGLPAWEAGRLARIGPPRAAQKEAVPARQKQGRQRRNLYDSDKLQPREQSTSAQGSPTTDHFPNQAKSTTRSPKGT